MANKIDKAIAAIETKLSALVTAGKIASVGRRPLNPANYPKSMPAVSVAWMGDLYREGGNWFVGLAVAILTRGGSAAQDDKLLEAVAIVDAALTELQAASGTLGGNIDQPRWGPWYHGTTEYNRVGAVALIRLQVQDPLVTT
jgi:hypothetical protein